MQYIITYLNRFVNKYVGMRNGDTKTTRCLKIIINLQQLNQSFALHFRLLRFLCYSKNSATFFSFHCRYFFINLWPYVLRCFLIYNSYDLYILRNISVSFSSNVLIYLYLFNIISVNLDTMEIYTHT